jgi:iron complex outermembrane receptor protein
MSGRSKLLSQAIVATLVLSSAQSLAQPQSDRAIETIVVTAQKREQSLQDVPIVVTAVSEQLIKDMGVKDIKDLTILTPGLIVTSSSNESITTARIRGVGTVGDNPGLESSVGVVIDGVYRPRNGVGFGDLGELERIEVLKGPQGTLFGKNTSAGVINVISKRPSFEFGSDIAVTAGNYGALEAEGSITGPIVADRIAGRLYASSRDRDGFYDVRTGEGPRGQKEDSDRNIYTVRGQLLFNLTDALDARLIADYSSRDENCCGAVKVLNGSTAPLVDLLAADEGLVTGDPFDRNAYLNRLTTQKITDRGVSLEINWDIGNATLTSVTGARSWKTKNAQDVDFTSADILYRNPDGTTQTEFDQFSQEIRVAGEAGKVNWLVGAFYAKEDLDFRAQLVSGEDMQEFISLRFAPADYPNRASWLADVIGSEIYVPGLPYQNDRHEQESTSYALFTNNSIAFTDQLELTLGLRYTKEEKELRTLYDNVNNGAACGQVLANVGTFSAQIPAALLPTFLLTTCATGADPAFNNLSNFQNSIDEDELSGTAKLAYRFTEDFMAYASYARGYKASGYNLDRSRRQTAQSPLGIGVPDLKTNFPAETVDSYELGAKTNWLGGSLLINGAVFYQIFENFQLNTFTGINFIVESVEEVRSQGVDLDFIWRAPESGFGLQGGVTYAKTWYSKPPTTANVLSPTRLNDRLSFAPLWSGSLSATYEFDVGSELVLRTNLGAKFTSSYNTGSNLAPQKIQDSYTLLNARVALGARDSAWSIELWSQNLTDEDYVQLIFDSVLQTNSFDAYLGSPRTYGLTARFRF